jgi:hypothetical protein
MRNWLAYSNCRLLGFFRTISHPVFYETFFFPKEFRFWDKGHCWKQDEPVLMRASPLLDAVEVVHRQCVYCGLEETFNVADQCAHFFAALDYYFRR